MSLIPEEKLKSNLSFNLAPMIDFLFLMLAFFAILAVTRATLFDTKLSLVQLKPEANASQIVSQEEKHQINISISKEGNYKWITDIQDYPLENVKHVQNEIIAHLEKGYIPQDKSKTQILLHIDKGSPWDPIAKIIFSIRDLGFDAHPIYEPKESS